MSDSRGHNPDGEWQFDEGVTACFDDMLERSIPQYSEMRALVTYFAECYRQRETTICDLGASRGEAIAPLIDKYGALNTYALVEVSEPMLAVLRERFAGWVDTGRLRIYDTDLRRGFPPERCSVILAVLTLQFVPIEYRQRVVTDAYEALLPGGALIVVEKILGDTAPIDNRLVDRYLAMKSEKGYSDDDIERKRLSLEGVLVPLTAEWNMRLLERAGFSQVDCFWRWCNFAGWVAIK